MFPGFSPTRPYGARRSREGVGKRTWERGCISRVTQGNFFYKINIFPYPDQPRSHPGKEPVNIYPTFGIQMKRRLLTQT